MSQEYVLVLMNVIIDVRICEMQWRTCVFSSLFVFHDDLDLQEGDLAFLDQLMSYCIVHILLQ